jgi:regulator of sirC expression with transglutaminase-like and TPR domain
MAALTDGELTALLKLLEDPNDATRARVEQSLAVLDPLVLDQLRDARDRMAPDVARRIEELAFFIPRRGALEDLASLVEAGGAQVDLEAGLWCLARFRDPDLVTAPYTRELERLSEAVRSRIRRVEPSVPTLKGFVQVLFQDEGFRGDVNSYYDPDNSFMHKVLERRRGIPVTLSALCLLVGHRVGLPIEGIGLPGHFVCRLGSGEQGVYFDPFNDGRLLTLQGCVELCHEAGFSFTETCLEPPSNREILMRMVRNLHDIYLQREALLEVRLLEDYEEALALGVDGEPDEVEERPDDDEAPGEVG